MKTLTYFVPVDFSDCSYNALQYATMLARFAEAKIRLCHVIDLEKVPESDNPVVVSFALDRLSKQAHEKMKSLREIISLENVSVDEQIVMGNIHFELIKQIEEVKPHVIVMGRNTDKNLRPDSLVSYITRNTTIPVLVVPRTHNPKIPSRALLATDMKSDKVVEFGPFFDVIKKISQELSVLNVRGRYSTNGKDAQNWISKLNSMYGINAKFLHRQNDDDVHNVVDFIRTNKVDLLCTIKRNPGFLDRFFYSHIPNQFATQVEVPVLLLNE